MDRQETQIVDLAAMRAEVQRMRTKEPAVKRYTVQDTGTRSYVLDRQTGHRVTGPMSGRAAKQKARDLNAQHYIETGR